MQLAETLGMRGRRASRTSSTPTPSAAPHVTGGSRTTFAGGWVAYELGQQIREQMRDRAARIWETDADKVEYGDDGVIRGPEGKR